jgi:ribosomal protein L36
MKVSPSIKACRRSSIQLVRRARHLVAYGSTNKYTEFVYFFCAIATMLMITATVKTMDSQRWICRIHLLKFNEISSQRWDRMKMSPKVIGHGYKCYRIAFGLTWLAFSLFKKPLATSE